MVIVKNITAGTVLGWRFWDVLPSGNLGSVYSGFVWIPKEPIRAICGRMVGMTFSKHDAPDEHCVCGVYVYKLKCTPPDDEIRIAVNYLSQFSYLAFGLVSAWGKIVEHQRGYRVEFAYPYAIFLVSRTAEGDRLLKMSEKISSAYGIKCIPLWKKSLNLVDEPAAFFSKESERLMCVSED